VKKCSCSTGSGGYMVKRDAFEKFEKELLRKEKICLKKKFQIMSALYKEVVALGVFPLKDPLEGIEVKIEKKYRAMCP
jgi:hypothetical protein